MATADAPGNLGLWDQNMALRWVQENIGKFGGDPTKVTLMGHGSGAASVSMHMVATASKGVAFISHLLCYSVVNSELIVIFQVCLSVQL